jgi:hypothetical protein
MFDSPSGLVITTRQVTEQGWPILLVTHDAEGPQGWQFLNGRGDTDDPSSGIPVHVEHLLDRDPSLLENSLIFHLAGELGGKPRTPRGLARQSIRSECLREHWGSQVC